MKTYFYFTAIILFFQTFLFSQDSSDYAHIHVIAKATDTGIILRWAPDRPLAWYLSLKSGYKIEREEMPDTKNATGKIVHTVLADSLRPWPLDDWQKISPPITKDQNAVVAAQMIHGNNWAATKSKSFITKAEELQNRFSYTLLAADLSAPAATASGLMFVDKQVRKGFKYHYRITSLAKSDLFIILPGTISIHEKTRTAIPVPVLDHIAQQDRLLTLAWEKQILENHFTAFHLERAEDGKSFSRITSVPFVNSDLSKDSLNDVFYLYQDSTAQNYKKYHYRIIGITPFAEYSTPSNVIIQYSIDKTPPPAPTQVRATQIGPAKIKLEWNHAGATDLKGFFVGHSFNPVSDYNILHLDPVPSGTHVYIHDSVNTLKANHYIIAAVDTAGNASYSLSTYGHLVDSIPPAIPTGLKGKIDTNGLVHLSWNANKEPDIMGYTIHFSNDSSHVFAVVTNKPILTNAFIDTIMLKTLTERIYYKVVAIDKNFNYSDFSPYIALQKPDLIPPSAPLFTEYKRDTNSITLHWINSTSKDAVKHILYRKETNDEWKVLDTKTTKNSTTSTFIDRSVKPGIEYEFKILAQDDAGHYSNSAFTYKIKTVAKDIIADVTDFVIKKEGTKAILTWSSSTKQPAQYIIYKAIEKGPFVAIDKTKTNSFVDNVGTQPKNIAYRIRIKYPDGKLSDYSPAQTL